MKIYLLGFMGCGKTHWAKLIGEKLGIPFFDLDQEIIASEGKSINELFADEGEEFFRRKETELLIAITKSKKSFVMACGGGTPCFFNNIDFMNKSGTTIWINCSVDCLHSRLVKEKGIRPLIRNLSDEELRGYIIKKYADRKIFYQQASIILNEDDITLEKMLEPIFHDKA